MERHSVGCTLDIDLCEVAHGERVGGIVKGGICAVADRMALYDTRTTASRRMLAIWRYLHSAAKAAKPSY